MKTHKRIFVSTRRLKKQLLATVDGNLFVAISGAIGTPKTTSVKALRAMLQSPGPGHLRVIEDGPEIHLGTDTARHTQ